MKPLWISYYTPDYEKRVKALKASLKYWELDCELDPIEDRGSWQRNSQWKPRFIWEKMAAYPGRPLVWIDADAKVLQYPERLEHGFDADLGVVEYKWPAQDRQELLSGTLWLSGKVRSVKLVDRWIGFCDEAPEMWDQRCLRKAVEAMRDGLLVEYLPIEYCFIHDTHREQFPGVEPIIVHYQESRAARQRDGARKAARP